MNNIKITYDGRITCWNSKPLVMRLSKTPLPSEKSEEMGLFSDLPEEAKQKFLLSSLGSSHDANSHSESEPAPRARRGLKGITSYGRSLIRMGCQYLEEVVGARQLSFLTCTLPPEALADCTPETWAEVLRRFLQSLRFHLGRACLSTELVGCIEVQGSRLLREQGRPPLHLHVVFQGRHRGKAWCFRPDFFQERWEVACRSVWGDIQGFQSSTRVESIRSSAVAYMGKYLSKGGEVLNLCKPELLPSSWYTISTKLKVFVKSQTFKCSGELAHKLYEFFYKGDHLLWARSLWSDWTETGTCYLIAWVGAIRDRSTYWEVVSDAREYLSVGRKNILTVVL